MGQNNQQRRKAKQKDRLRARQASAARSRPGSGDATDPRRDWGGRSEEHAPRRPESPEPGLADAVRLRERIDALVGEACSAAVAERRDGFQAAIAGIVVLGGTADALATVRGAVIEHLTSELRDVWRRGWQPLDLYEYLRRRHERLDLELLGDVIASDLATYPRSRVDDRWFGQLTTYGASVWWPSSSSYLVARTFSGGSWTVVLEAAVRVLAGLRWLAPLESFLPLPGAASPATTHRVARVDDKVLFRVRQMLAQAESTTYEAEAETFTAAAQKLMARHSIDQAMLTAADPARRGGGPTGRRIWMATPYVKEKVLLLDAVARANRVRTVWSTADDLVTLMGYEVDLEAVDTLFTSLLLQATQAMNAEGRRVSAGGGSRTRSFRSSFLAAYAMQIGERLQEVTVAETESAATDYRRSTGAELVPVLSARAAEVEDYTARLFPGVVHKSVSVGRDREGWVKGRQAAEQAKLTWGEAIEN